MSGKTIKGKKTTIKRPAKDPEKTIKRHIRQNRGGQSRRRRRQGEAMPAAARGRQAPETPA